MQRVAWKFQAPGQFRGPARPDETQIEIFVRAVDFIAHERMPQRRGMNANLVHATRPRSRRKQRKFFAVAREPIQNRKLRLRRRTFRMNRLLQPDPEGSARSFAQNRGVDFMLFPIWPAGHDGPIFLFYFTPLELPGKMPGCRCRRGNQKETAGFAVESVNEGDLATACKLKRKPTFQ